MHTQHTLNTEEAQKILHLHFSSVVTPGDTVSVIIKDKALDDAISLASAENLRQALAENNLITAIKEVRACLPFLCCLPNASSKRFAKARGTISGIVRRLVDSTTQSLRFVRGDWLVQSCTK